MINREVANFISSNLRRGLSYNEIHSQLLARGYSDFEINQARDALMSGQKLDSPKDISESRLGVKWFFYTIGIVVFVVFMFIIFGIIISNANPVKYTISEDAVFVGTSFNVTKNAMVEIDSFRGKYLLLTLVANDREVLFTGDLGGFSVPRNANKLFDVDSDGINDLKIMYSYEDGQRMVHFNGICVENWKCEEWGACVDGKKVRVCVDENACGSSVSSPLIEEPCFDLVLDNYSVVDEVKFEEREVVLD